MNWFLLPIFLVFNGVLFSQEMSALFYMDTIKGTDRIAGELDSTDLNIGVHAINIPGGSEGLTFGVPTIYFLSHNFGAQRFYGIQDQNNFKFSGLPHLGFAYSFGSQGTQYIQAEYQQVINNRVFMNLDYRRNNSSGFMRNSGFQHDDLKARFLLRSKFISATLDAYFGSSSVGINGGYVDDSLIRTFSSDLLPVRQGSSVWGSKRTQIEHVNFIPIVKDSIRSVGVIIEESMKILSTRFTESDTLYGIYAFNQFDTLSTYDLFQHSQVGAGAGMFFRSNHHYFKATNTFNYWWLNGNGIKNDTLENNINVVYAFRSKRMILSSEGKINIIGANNEWQEKLKLHYTFPFFKLTSNISISNLLPTTLQRFAVGNNYIPSVNKWNKQMRFASSLVGEKEFQYLNLSLGYGLCSYGDNLMFQDSTWSHYGGFTAHQIQLKAAGQMKWLKMSANYNYSFTPKSVQWIPDHRLTLRLFAQGNLFKAKKMKAQIGSDLILLSAYDKLSIYAPLNVFLIQSGDIQLSTRGNYFLNLFGGFQIDDFKFFVRVENINALWGDPLQKVQYNYLVPRMQFRLGITWDFFN